MMDRRGFGMSSVRFICGTQDIHKELEAAITEYFQTEDTIPNAVARCSFTFPYMLLRFISYVEFILQINT